jgi:hypothetical protein
MFSLTLPPLAPNFGIIPVDVEKMVIRAEMAVSIDTFMW